jgi:hypothetical protein
MNIVAKCYPHKKQENTGNKIQIFLTKSLVLINSMLFSYFGQKHFSDSYHPKPYSCFVSRPCVIVYLDQRYRVIFIVKEVAKIMVNSPCSANHPGIKNKKGKPCIMWKFWGEILVNYANCLQHSNYIVTELIFK